MSNFAWGQTDVQIRNQTLLGLKPNTIYEFGLNLIYTNNTFARFPSPDRGDMCACKTHPDVPSKPEKVRYHYIQDEEYLLQWIPGLDNGEHIVTYDLQTMPINGQPIRQWQPLTPYNVTENRLNFILGTQERSAIQLRAVNKIGPGEPALLTIQPPVRATSNQPQAYSTLFGPVDNAVGVVLISLLSVGAFLLLLLLIAFFYRRRRCDGKIGNHPFAITFNASRRINSGSGNDSFGLGGASDLTTSGIPLDLSTLEPLWNQEVNSLYGLGKSDLLSFEQVNQISVSNIRFHRYIGCGAFGKVYEGWLHLNDIDGDRFEKVALKVRNNKSLSEAEFRREATLMHRYQQTNIVRFYGVSFDSPGQQCLILEMMDQGNLRDYLHRARPRIAPNVAANMFAAAAAMSAAGSSTGNVQPSPGSAGSTSLLTSADATGGAGGVAFSATVAPLSASTNGPTSLMESTSNSAIKLKAQLDLPALVSIMRDIANACQYLEEQHFVHRDIAARNCLVSHSHPSGRIVKLCDFGLARDIYKNDCYRKRNEPKLPVRWMSPEAIRDGLFTFKSDVWAFAVTCWEVMTLGADPFYGRTNMDVMNLVIGGHVLGRPENCPEELYDQMLQCWSRFPEMRPSFADLAMKMNEFVQLSHDTASVFSGPFIVSLPLPKSLPESNLLVCTPAVEQHHYHHQPNRMEFKQAPCQRSASLNEHKPFIMTSPDVTGMQHSAIFNRAGYQTLQSRSESTRRAEDHLPRDATQHYLINSQYVGPITETHRTYETASPRLPEDTSTSEPIDVISDGMGIVNQSVAIMANSFDADKPLPQTPSLTSSITTRPISLFEQSTRPPPYMSNQAGLPDHPLFYRTLNPHRVGSMASHLTTRSVLANAPNGPFPRAVYGNTGSTAPKRSLTNYWYRSPASGGVDSLGYERPTWIGGQTPQPWPASQLPRLSAHMQPIADPRHVTTQQLTGMNTEGHLSS